MLPCWIGHQLAEDVEALRIGHASLLFKNVARARPLEGWGSSPFNRPLIRTYLVVQTCASYLPSPMQHRETGLGSEKAGTLLHE